MASSSSSGLTVGELCRHADLVSMDVLDVTGEALRQVWCFAVFVNNVSVLNICLKAFIVIFDALPFLVVFHVSYFQPLSLARFFK